MDTGSPLLEETIPAGPESPDTGSYYFDISSRGLSRIDFTVKGCWGLRIGLLRAAGDYTNFIEIRAGTNQNQRVTLE